MKVTRNIFRILIGLVFIFSGFVKGVDPLGTQYRIEDYFIALSNSVQSLITNMKLQKLMYYAQAWHLAVIGDELFSDDFQAWIHGPVIPALYDKYKAYQWNPIIRNDIV